MLFILFLVISYSFFIIPVVKGNRRVKLALAIPTRTPTILAKAIIDTSLLAADNKTEVLPI